MWADDKRLICAFATAIALKALIIVQTLVNTKSSCIGRLQLNKRVRPFVQA